MNSIEEEQDDEEDEKSEFTFKSDRHHGSNHHHHGNTVTTTPDRNNHIGAASSDDNSPRCDGGCSEGSTTQPAVAVGSVAVALRGVLFGRSIRSSYACLHLYPLSEYELLQENGSSSSGDDDEGENHEDNRDHDDDTVPQLLRSSSSSTRKPLLVRLQLVEKNDSLSSLRSHIRRQFKMGDLLCIVRPPTVAITAAEAAATRTRTAAPMATAEDGQQQQQQQQGAKQEEDRMILHLSSILEATCLVRVEHNQYWKMSRVQQVQAAHRQLLVGEASNHYSTSNNNNTHNQNKSSKPKNQPSSSTRPRPPPCLNGHAHEVDIGFGDGCCSHGGGGALEKRKLALYMANFVVHMTMNQIVKTRRQRQQQQTETQQQQQEEVSSSSSSSWYNDYVPLVPSQWATTCPWQSAPHDLVRVAIQNLNSSKTRKAAENEQEKQHPAANSNGNGSTRTTDDGTNSGGGVLDVAGGSGLVSMALGMLFGVRSTVVDPRPSAGKLPRRDRKMYQRAIHNGYHGSCSQRAEEQNKDSGPRDSKQLQTKEYGPDNRNENDSGNQTTGAWHQQQQQQLEHCGDFWSSRPFYCQPVQFDTRRAWFGERILAATSTNDPQPEQSVVGQISSNRDSGSDADDGLEYDRLLSSCTAIVALHPDQATDAVVEVALRQEIPFVVVPCCVFSRLFPHRRRPYATDNKSADGNLNNEYEHADDLSVNTRLQLIQYLQAKDDRILRVDMPFIGANTVLWCTF